MRSARPSSITIVSIAAALALTAAGCSSSGSDDVEPAETFETVAPSEAASTDATTVPVDSSASTDAATQPADTGSPATVETAATTVAPAALVDPAVGLVEVGTFDRPVDVATRPQDGRLFVIGQNGTVTAADGSATVVLDVTDRITSAGNEQGLLGLAFHPTLDLAYVDFTNAQGDTVGRIVTPVMAGKVLANAARKPCPFVPQYVDTLTTKPPIRKYSPYFMRSFIPLSLFCACSAYCSTALTVLIL